MPFDFSTKQLRVTQIITSGGLGLTGKNNLGLLIYSSSKAPDFAGTIPAAMYSNIGQDTYVFISGSRKAKQSVGGAVVFGGDTVTSGAMYFEELPTSYVPGTIADGTVTLYAKDVSGVTKLFVKNEAEELEVGGGFVGSSMVWADGKNKAKTSGSISIDASNYYVDTYGSDIFFYVSGARGGKLLHASGTSVFSGDLITSGNVYFGLTEQNTSFGKDINFFVSGSTGSKGTTISGSALFGGDLVVSGTLYAEKMVVEVDESVTGSFSISGSLYVSQSAEIYEGLIVNKSAEGDPENDTRIITQNKTHAFFVDTSADRVLVLSGGNSLSANEASGSDVSFYVSGAIGGREGTNKGASLFGGDLIASGALWAGDNLRLSSSSDSDAIITNPTNNKDIVFRVTDANIDTTILTIDGSESAILVADEKQLQFGDANAYIAGNTSAGTLSLEATIIETDSPVTASKGIHIDSDNASLQIGAGPDLILSSTSDNAIIGNATSDKDIIFRINDGGVDKTLVTLDASDTTLKLGESGTGADAIFYGKDSDAIGLHWDADQTEHGKLTLGQDNHGVDFQVYGETSSKYLKWDQSTDTFYLWGSLSTRYDQVFRCLQSRLGFHRKQ